MAVCYFTLTPSSMDFRSAEAGSGMIQVDASDAACVWSATSASDWITIVSPVFPFTGSGVLIYTVDENTAVNSSTVPRVGKITITGWGDFFICQAGTAAFLSQSSFSTAYNSIGGSFNIAAAATDQWKVINNNPDWITPVMAFSGTGSSDVSFTVHENESAATRIGSLIVINNRQPISDSSKASFIGSNFRPFIQAFTIIQSGHGMSICPTKGIAKATGAKGLVNITTNPNSVNWSISNISAEITPSVSAGTGAAQITYTIDDNGGASRELTIEFSCGIGDPIVVTITQDGV